MNLRQAAEMALHALEDIFGREKVDVGAINALRAALAEADEPVAWRYKIEGSEKWRLSSMTPNEAREWNDIVEEEPLYTHPPRRERLTEEAIEAFAREIERAHGIGADE